MLAPTADPRWRSLSNKVEWSPQEQSILEDGLQKYSTEHTPLAKYIKVAAELANKNVRDVALRVQWMKSKDAISRKRKAEDAAAANAAAATKTTGKAKRGANASSTTTATSSAATGVSQGGATGGAPPMGGYPPGGGMYGQPSSFVGPPPGMMGPPPSFVGPQLFHFEEHGGTNLLESKSGMSANQSASLRSIGRMLEENIHSFTQIRTRISQMRMNEVGDMLRVLSDRVVDMMGQMSGVGMVPMPPLPVKMLSTRFA